MINCANRYSTGDKVQVFTYLNHNMSMYDGDSGVVLEQVTNRMGLINVILTHNSETMIVPLYANELRPASDQIIVAVKTYLSDYYEKILSNETRFTWRDNLDFWLNRHPEFAGDWKSIHCNSNRILERGFVGERPIGMQIKE